MNGLRVVRDGVEIAVPLEIEARGPEAVEEYLDNLNDEVPGPAPTDDAVEIDELADDDDEEGEE